MDWHSSPTEPGAAWQDGQGGMWLTVDSLSAIYLFSYHPAPVDAGGKDASSMVRRRLNQMVPGWISLFNFSYASSTNKNIYCRERKPLGTVNQIFFFTLDLNDSVIFIPMFIAQHSTTHVLKDKNVFSWCIREEIPADLCLRSLCKCTGCILVNRWFKRKRSTEKAWVATERLMWLSEQIQMLAWPPPESRVLQTATTENDQGDIELSARDNREDTQVACQIHVKIKACSFQMFLWVL